jgi:hypothetical protein
MRFEHWTGDGFHFCPVHTRRGGVVGHCGGRTAHGAVDARPALSVDVGRGGVPLGRHRRALRGLGVGVGQGDHKGTPGTKIIPGDASTNTRT